MSNAITAPLWRRLCAIFYDAWLILAIWFFIELCVVAINHGQSMTAMQRPFVQSIVFLSSFGFFAGFWMHGGRTLGMLAWRIRLVTLNGEPLRLSQCLLRFMVSIFSWLCLGLGFWWMIWDKDHLTWHDRYSMTRLIVTQRNK